MAIFSFETWKNFAIEVLAPHLSDRLIEEALTTILSSQPYYLKKLGVLIDGETVSILAPYLPKQLLEKVVDNFPRIYWINTYHDARFLTAMARYWPKEQAKALEVAREIEQEYYRVKMLWELAVYFPELKEEAIEIARSIKEEGTRRRVLSDLLPQMPQQLISKVLDIAFSLPESQRFEQSRLLIATFPYLLPELIVRVLEKICSMKDSYEKVNLLEELAPRLPSELIEPALNIARKIDDEWTQARALSG